MNFDILRAVNPAGDTIDQALTDALTEVLKDFIDPEEYNLELVVGDCVEAVVGDIMITDLDHPDYKKIRSAYEDHDLIILEN